jgi:hypothetical protein
MDNATAYTRVVSTALRVGRSAPAPDRAPELRSCERDHGDFDAAALIPEHRYGIPHPRLRDHAKINTAFVITEQRLRKTAPEFR